MLGREKNEPAVFKSEIIPSVPGGTFYIPDSRGHDIPAKCNGVCMN